ncbi:MAG: RidA family protein [Pseudomonadales bacterium]|nr:RidA family protein [Pseudomonadales bacterium]
MPTLPARTLSRRALLTALTSTLAVVATRSLQVQAADAGDDVEARLRALGLELPQLAPAVANYVPFVRDGDRVYIAGQLPVAAGTLLHPGKVPTEVSLEQAQQAARQCALNVLAALKRACDDDLNRVRRCLRLEGFVASADDFQQQSLVMNAASDLMVDVFADKGRHTRVAVGVNSLPLNACVEISAIFAINQV